MDELEAQLKRYADAAEADVPATPEVRSRRSRRPMLAVAAALVLIGGPLGVLFATRDSDEQIETVPADTTTQPILLPRHQCPIPAVTPDLEHLQMALPMVARAEQSFGPSEAGNDEQIMMIAPDTDGWVEVRVESVAPDPDLLDPPTGASTQRVAVCDPFHHDGPVPRTVLAVRSDDGDARRLSFPLGSAWTVSVRTGLEPSSTITDDLLFQIIAGMSFPDRGSSGGEPGATTTSIQTDDAVCEPDPEVAIEVGSFTLTVMPDGYEPKLPVGVEDTGVQVDLGGGSTASLSLVHPDGRTIQVTAFGAESPRQFILDAFAGGGEYEPVNVRRCARTANGWERLDGLASTGSKGGRTMLAAQEWEYEGYLVVGSAGTGRDEILAVAEGLRFGSIP